MVEKEGKVQTETPDVYDLDRLADIKKWCEQRGMSYCKTSAFLTGRTRTICKLFGIPCVQLWNADLNMKVYCPVPFNFDVKPPLLHPGYGLWFKLTVARSVFSYALAVSEENASGRHHCYSTYLWCKRCCSGCSVSYSENTPFPHPPDLHALAISCSIGYRQKPYRSRVLKPAVRLKLVLLAPWLLLLPTTSLAARWQPSSMPLKWVWNTT